MDKKKLIRLSALLRYANRVELDGQTVWGMCNYVTDKGEARLRLNHTDGDGRVAEVTVLDPQVDEGWLRGTAAIGATSIGEWKVCCARTRKVMTLNLYAMRPLMPHDLPAELFAGATT